MSESGPTGERPWSRAQIEALEQRGWKPLAAISNYYQGVVEKTVSTILVKTIIDHLEPTANEAIKFTYGEKKRVYYSPKFQARIGRELRFERRYAHRAQELDEAIETLNNLDTK